MDFFHSLPIPEFWEFFFSFPSRSLILGMGFFPFPSRSRISGMELSIPVPVPKLQKFCSYNRASTYLMIIAQAVGPARSSSVEVKLEERNRLIDVFTEGPLVYFLGKKIPAKVYLLFFALLRASLGW